MTIDIKYEKAMTIVWLAMAVLNLVCTIVNIIGEDWLDFILFLNITTLCINLCLKHNQVTILADEIDKLQTNKQKTTMTAKTLHLHTFSDGYHLALDDTSQIQGYPMQFVVSFRTQDQRGEWSGPHARQGFFISYVNAKEYFDFVIDAYEKDLERFAEQECRHNAAMEKYRAMRNATAHLSEKEQQQAINDFRCGKYKTTN